MNLEPIKGRDDDVTDEQLTSGQAARMLGLSQPYLARLARLGKIEFEETPHGYRVYRRSDLERLARRRAAGTAA